MNHGLCGLVAAVALVFAGLAVVPSAAATGGSTNCGFGCHTTVKSGAIGAPDGGAFTGTQVVRQPDGKAAPFGAGHAGSQCPGCTYDLVPVCSLGDGASLCPTTLACPDPAATRFFVYVTRPGAIREFRGDVCLAPNERPVDTAQITSAVQQYVDELVPTSNDLRIQPPNGAYVNLPTIFHAATGTEPVTREFFPLGFTVRVTAKPTSWTWTFDNGVTTTTQHPGIPYAGGDVANDSRYVSHTYAQPGARTVRVVTTWSASYDLQGLGTVQVPGTVQRDSGPISLQVREGRSQLIAGRG